MFQGSGFNFHFSASSSTLIGAVRILDSGFSSISSPATTSGCFYTGVWAFGGGFLTGSPLWKVPSKTNLSLLKSLPDPSCFPFFHWPSYLPSSSPLKKYVPVPFFTPFSYYPSYLRPSDHRYVPKPFIRPALQSPSYTSLLGKIILPDPFGFKSSPMLPLYSLLSGHLIWA